MFSSALIGQENSHPVDSLSNEVNTISGEFEKALALEKALNQIVIDDFDSVLRPLFSVPLNP